MRKLGLLASAFALLAISASNAVAAEACPGNPEAIGTSRTLSVNPAKIRRIGTVQYAETLPLKDGEIVLTFDDGPVPPSSETILDTLASECVKATFFMLGEHSKDAPDVARRAYREGHSIGSHTETHSHLDQLTFEAAKEEIEMGINSVKSALGDQGTLSPFFRAPFLATTPKIDTFLRSKNIMLWGIDFQADDWLFLPPDEVVRRALLKIDFQRKGVLLLHDIQDRTALALPKLLKELKKRNMKIVHVVADTPAPASAAALKK